MRRIFGQLVSISLTSLRKLEQDMETVINVLQPGPLGIIEHKFSNKEIVEARAATDEAIENWRQAFLKRKKTDSGSSN
eukprot:Gb_23223 [translate_table: standard]